MLNRIDSSSSVATSAASPSLSVPSAKLDLDYKQIPNPDHPINDSEHVVLLDPKSIRPGLFPNRHKTSFEDDSFEQLRQSILQSGCNIVPILVRPIPVVGNVEFEVIYGQRRLRACKESGMRVRAIISADEDAARNFFTTIRENQNRVDLSAWEIGRQAKFAIDQKLCASQSRLSTEMGCSKSRISEAIQLASLPEEILQAFNSPADLQFRHAKQLTDALKSNRDGVFAEAAKILEMGENLKPQDIVSRLVDAAGTTVRPSNDRTEIAVNCDGTAIGKLLFDKTGIVEVNFELPLQEKQRTALLLQLQSFFRRNVLKASRSAGTKQEVMQ